MSLRPTPTGWALTALTLVLLGLGLGVPAPEAVAGAVTGLGALLTGLAAVAAAPRAHAERHEVRELRAGQSATVLVDARAGTGPRTWLLRTHLVDRLAGQSSRGLLQSGRIRYRLTPARRGPAALGPLLVEHTDLLGLWRRARPLAPAEVVLVHPRLIRLPGPGRLAGFGAGEGPGGGLADGQVGGVRPYQDGDERRSVHWLSSARAGSLMVRQYAGGSAGRLDLWLVTSAGEYRREEDFEDAVALAAGIVQACLADPVPCRLHTTGGLQLTGDGPADRSRLLDALATVRADASDPTVDAEPGSTTVVVRGGGDGPGLTLRITGEDAVTEAVRQWKGWCGQWRR